MGSIILCTIRRYWLLFDNGGGELGRVGILLAEVKMQGRMTYCDQLGQTTSANR
jgi:hypothetical protein